MIVLLYLCVCKRFVSFSVEFREPEYCSFHALPYTQVPITVEQDAGAARVNNPRRVALGCTTPHNEDRRLGQRNPL